MSRIIKKMFKIIKIQHHLHNFTQRGRGSAINMINRKVAELIDYVKPALPNTRVQDLLLGNSKNWGVNTETILTDHYKYTLTQLYQDLKTERYNDWPEALTVAERWARRNLPRITDSSLTEACNNITDCFQLEALIDLGPPAPPESHVPRKAPQKRGDGPPRQIRATARSDQASTRSVDSSVRAADPPAGPSWYHADAGPPTQTQPLDQTEHLVPDVPPQVEPERAQRDGPLEQRTVRFNLPANQAEERELQVSQTNSVNSPVDTRAQSPVDSIPSPLFQDDDENPLGCTIDFRLLMSDEDQSSALESEDDLLEHTPESHSHGFGVVRHQNTNRKNKVWGLHVEQPCVIIGDSNLDTIGSHDYSGLQIDSFPGATFRNATFLLQRAVVHTQVNKLVLAFGINSRSCDPKATSIKQLNMALRVAARKFPDAQVYVPLINYSLDLPQSEQLNLHELNTYIHQRVPAHLPLLPENSFTTTEDKVHWTPETAQTMLRHWAEELNF